MKKTKLLLVLLLSLTLLIQQNPVYAQNETPDLPIYIVQPGDSINLIALKFDVAAEDLMAVNGITDANFLQVNQQLVIPGISGAKGLLSFHPVELGETAATIARKSKISIETLNKINRITSPSEFYLGANIIYTTPLNPDDSNAIYQELNQINGQNAIESAIINQSNHWQIIQENQQKYTWEYNNFDNYVGFINQSTSHESEIIFKGLPLSQGTTASITINNAQTVSSAYLDDMQLPFSENNGSLSVIFGVHAFHDPGLVPIHIEYTDTENNTTTIDQFIIIQAGFFAQDPPLYVDPATLEPAYTEPENILLAETTSEVTPEQFWNGPFSAPVDEPICIKSWFGNRRSYNDSPYDSFHTGVDYGVCATLNIYAPADGKVVYTGPLNIRGNATIINHGLGVYTGYWHQESILVNTGDFVERGQLIGLIGTTGRSTGPHLHWEIIANGVQVDPLDWLLNTYP